MPLLMVNERNHWRKKTFFFDIFTTWISNMLIPIDLFYIYIYIYLDSDIKFPSCWDQKKHTLLLKEFDPPGRWGRSKSPMWSSASMGLGNPSGIVSWRWNRVVEMPQMPKKRCLNHIWHLLTLPRYIHTGHNTVYIMNLDTVPKTNIAPKNDGFQ